MRGLGRAGILSGVFLFGAAGQETPPLRITVRLVQIDAVARDKSGHYVDDLKREELRLFQDGKEHKITYFSYSGGRPAVAPSPQGKGEQGRAPAPAPPMTAGSIRRTVALVVDDLGLSWESMHRVKQALREFVDKQVQPGDAVAIIRTGTGIGTLQQFTTDRRMLITAIDRLRWTGLSRGGIDSVDLAGEDEPPPVTGGRASPMSLKIFERFRSFSYTLGTLGALNHVVEELREKPGRKSAVLFSDGLQMFADYGDELTGGSISTRLRRLCDRANRAGVAFYTVDTRGLMVLSMRAGDRVRSARAARELADNRHKEYVKNQDGLALLARETGGVFSSDQNDLAAAAANALGDQSGYYLIGYDPGPGIFQDGRSAKEYHRIKLKVTRPGVTVRTRSGFYGVEDRPSPPPRTDRSSQLLAAIRNPFQSGGIGLRLSAVYAITEQTGPAILSMLHIDGANLDFRNDTEGDLTATVDVALISFGEDGRAETSTADTYQIQIKPEKLEEARLRGFVYKVTHQFTRPGPYQVRVAVRDASSGEVGSASQFVELPDWKKKDLAVSGILLSVNGGGNAASVLRQFAPETKISYAFEVYNAKAGTEVLARLYREGKLVWTGKEYTLESPQVRLPLSRELTIEKGTPPGSYVLEVVARRRDGKNIKDVATQWTDFALAGGSE